MVAASVCQFLVMHINMINLAQSRGNDLNGNVPDGDGVRLTEREIVLFKNRVLLKARLGSSPEITILLITLPRVQANGVTSCFRPLSINFDGLD